MYTHLGGVVAYRVEPRRALLSFPKFWNLFLPLSLMTLLVRVEERDGCVLSNGFVGMSARGNKGAFTASKQMTSAARSIVRIGIDWDRARLDRNYFVPCLTTNDGTGMESRIPADVRSSLSSDPWLHTGGALLCSWWTRVEWGKSSDDQWDQECWRIIER